MSASPNFPGLPEGWQESENQVVKNIFTRVFHRKDWGQGRLLFVVHGFGEQSNRYLHYPHFLNGAIDAIVALDLPGHGNSAGSRGHIEKFSVYEDAVITAFEDAVRLVRSKAGACVPHVFGHSFGGLTVAHMALVSRSFEKLGVKSFSLSSPFLDVGFPVPEAKKKFGLFVEPLLGWLPIKNELDPKSLTHDSSVIEAYKKDPLNHGWITPRAFVHMTRAQEETRASTADFPADWAMFVPTGDTVSHVATNLKFHETHAASTKHKHELHTFNGFYHEGFNEEGKEKPFAALKAWLEQPHS